MIQIRLNAYTYADLVCLSVWIYHARMARRAQHLYDAPLGELCEGSERADNKLDKSGSDIVRPSFEANGRFKFARGFTGLRCSFLRFSPIPGKGGCAWRIKS